MDWIVSQDGRTMVNADSIRQIKIVGSGILCFEVSTDPNKYIVLGSYKDENRTSDVFVRLVETLNMPFTDPVYYMPED